MATAPVTLNDTKTTLLNIVNQMDGSNVTISDVDFGAPQRATGALPIRNTKIILTPKSDSGYYGIKTLWYNRIHISEIGPIAVEKGSATTVAQLIPEINDKYGISLIASDIIDESLSPLQTGEISVSLNINPNSLVFYNGDIIPTQSFTPGTPTSPLVPSIWDSVVKSVLITIGPENYEITASAGISMVRSNASFSSGKRYFELKNTSTHGLIGICLATASTSTLLGSDSNSWALNTNTGIISHNGATAMDLSSQVALMGDNPIGFMLDLDSKLLTLVLIGNVRIELLGITIPNEPIFVAAGNSSTLEIMSNIQANFGAYSFTFSVPFEYYPGFGTGGSATIPTSGTLLSQLCVGGDLIGTYANGSGGTYTSLIEANSPTCVTPPPSSTPAPTPTPAPTLPPVVLPTVSNDVIVTGNSTYILPLGTIEVVLIGAGDPGVDAVTETLTEDTPIYLVENSIPATIDYWIAVINNETATEAIRIKNTGEVESSTDGVTWSLTGTVDLTLSSTVLPGDLSVTSVYTTFANGYYYVFTAYGSYFRSNDAGATWVEINGLSSLAGAANIVKLLYGNSTYVLFTDTNNLAISTDGLNFTIKDYLTDYGVDYQDGFLDVAFNGVVFTALHANLLEAVTTTDFITLSKNTLPAVTSPNEVFYITNINSTFITSGIIASGSGEYLTSPDGINWTVRSSTFEAYNSYFNNINGILILAKNTLDTTTYVYNSLNGLVSTDGINWLKIRPANDPTYSTTYKLPLPFYLDGKFRCLPFTDEGSAVTYGDYLYTGTSQLTNDVIVLTPAVAGSNTDVELLGTTYTYNGSGDSTPPVAIENTVTIDPLNTDTVTYNVSINGSLTIREIRNEYTSTLSLESLNASEITVNEGDVIDAVFTLDNVLERDVSFIFNLDYQTSTALDFTTIQYSIGTDVGAVYTDIVDGDTITLPIGETLITVRFTTATDAAVDGDTTFSVSLTKTPGTTVVLNTTAVTKTMTIIDITV